MTVRDPIGRCRSARGPLCAILSCLLGLLPPLGGELWAQSAAAPAPSFSAARPSVVPSSAATVARPSPALPTATREYSSQLSGLERLLETLIEADAGRQNEPYMPGLGGYGSVEDVIPTIDAAFDVALYSGRQTLTMSYLEQFTTLHAGIAASRDIGPTYLYVGAGLERMRLETHHPDVHGFRHVLHAAYTDLERAMMDGEAAYLPDGYTPRLDLGAGLSLDPVEFGAGLSLGRYPGLTLSTKLSLF